MMKTKTVMNCEVTATMVPDHSGMWTVHVTYRFDSGNFVREKPIENLSRVTAEGLLEFYTR